jgi:hypothetical protein
MNRRATSRWLITAIAAYAFVVQAILAGFSSAVMAGTPADGLLCTSSVNAEGPANGQLPLPVHRVDCCVALGCSFAANAAVLVSTAAPPLLRTAVAANPVVSRQAIGLWPSERPRSSRAPPAKIG